MQADTEHGRPALLTPSSERPRSFFARNSASNAHDEASESEEDKGRPTKWSMGVLNDPTTHEVPGSVLLLTGNRNEPLGLRNAPARTSASSLPPVLVPSRRSSKHGEGKKKTADGAIILEPQPEDTYNDPLNWPTWRRDAALLSLGLYCMVGGGMTPILAAGFTNVAATYNVTTPKVSLTTGLYMMGLGVGSVIASPTAILWGKRPVYLVSAIIFIATSIWCATSPSYNSLLVARIFQGISVSPVECLPSATIAEIFFLHERAYRIGIYTLLLLGGKNLVPLVSAAIIQSLSWRWVFWIVAMVVGFCGCLLFLFVPESFWDRTPVPKSRRASKHHGSWHNVTLFSSRSSHKAAHRDADNEANGNQDDAVLEKDAVNDHENPTTPKKAVLASGAQPHRDLHVGFAAENRVSYNGAGRTPIEPVIPSTGTTVNPSDFDSTPDPAHEWAGMVRPSSNAPPTPALHNFNSPWYKDVEKNSADYIQAGLDINNDGTTSPLPDQVEPSLPTKPVAPYIAHLRQAPPQTFIQQLRPFQGRLNYDKWLRVAIRPFILFAYPAVLWSAVVYSCAVGWLIVLSESVAVIYRTRSTYNFSALSTGLIYLSPFIGGVLGTAVAGKVSDIIVRSMSRRNGGLYEPEFRLVMAAPVAVTTVIGLMGFGWSAQAHDAWIVPTIFFGVISFGCSLGSTTAITFCVDSYRQYAGEALVTLNFSKNIFHGLVFSLFFTKWLETDGSKKVFIWLGVIQLIFMAFTIPMYIFGKRARMWTVRKNLMEKF
ncbi:MFS general substrate transporter [Acephala macrosclerotiorum]|nr:MFS general substrate transporter [Acephala macrosclerotiorum]